MLPPKKKAHMHASLSSSFSSSSSPLLLSGVVCFFQHPHPTLLRCNCCFVLRLFETRVQCERAALWHCGRILSRVCGPCDASTLQRRCSGADGGEGVHEYALFLIVGEISSHHTLEPACVRVCVLAYGLTTQESRSWVMTCVAVLWVYPACMSRSVDTIANLVTETERAGERAS